MRLVAGVSTFLVCASPSAEAQGVPTQDNAGLGQLFSILSQLGEDMEAQQSHLGTARSLSSVQADQLRVLEAMSAALSMSGPWKAMPTSLSETSIRSPPITLWTAGSLVKAARPLR